MINLDLMRSQKSHIEFDIVTYEPSISDEVPQLVPNRVPIWGSVHVCLRDARQRNDELRQPDTRIHQRMEHAQLLVAPKLDRAYINDAIGFGVQTCRFQIECHQRLNTRRY